MRHWILLFLLAWLSPALAHHHHGISLDPAASVATPHLAGSNNVPTATPTPPPAGFVPTEVATANLHNQNGFAPLGLSLLLLLGGWGVWQLLRGARKTAIARASSDEPPATH